MTHLRNLTPVVRWSSLGEKQKERKQLWEGFQCSVPSPRLVNASFEPEGDRFRCFIWFLLDIYDSSCILYVMIYIFCIYVAVFQMMIIWLWTIESKYDVPHMLHRTFFFFLPMTGKHSPSWLVQKEEEERQKTGEEFQQKWEEWEEGRRMVACWSTNKQILEN